MMRHAVGTVPDDLTALQARPDELALAGAQVVSVLWQARRVGEEQSGVGDSRGSFVIASPGEPVLRDREVVADAETMLEA